MCAPVCSVNGSMCTPFVCSVNGVMYVLTCVVQMVVCMHVHACVLVHIYMGAHVCVHKMLPFIKSCHSREKH